MPPTTRRIPVYGSLVRQVEVDCGAVPGVEFLFTVTDPNVNIASHLFAQIAYEAPTGKDLDELDMDAIDVKVSGPSSGTFQLHVKGLEGEIEGKFKVNYIIG